jgi:signal transduction histidine kinase
MTDTPESTSSLYQQSVRRQFWAGIALVSVLPILIFFYLQSNDQQEFPCFSIPYLALYFIVLTLGVTGYILLRRHPSHLLTLRDRLEKELQRELTDKNLKRTNPNDIAAIDGYLSVLVEQLKSRMGTAEQENLRLQEQLFQAQKLESLSAMATSVAHDFSNCLAAISGNINIVLRSLPESSARDHAKQADAVTMRAVELTNELLITAGRGRFVPEKLNLSDLIESRADSLRAAIPPNVTVEYHLAENLPLITADREQLRHAVTHLVVNAAESYAGQPGTVIVTTDSMNCDRRYLSQTFLDMNLPEDKYVYVDVFNSGVAIPREIQSRIFEPFFSTRIRGRGLGLSIVLGVARAHFAAVKLQSEPGKGTSFRLLFQTSQVIIDPL